VPHARVDLSEATERGPVWRHYVRAIGPGLVTGASDDDPSALLTYASAGAQAGHGLLWTGAVAFPLMVAVQMNADRTALVTGRNVGTLARQRFGRGGRRVFGLLLVGHVLANVLVIAADLLAVGSAVELLHGGPAWLWAPVAGALVTVLVMTGSFAAIARVLKVLCLALLGYVAVLFTMDLDWGQALRSLVTPHVEFTPVYLGLLLATFGATLPPYVFLWQSTHRLEEMREEQVGGDLALPLDRRRPEQARRKRRTSALDVVCGMAFAVLVMLAVILATAGTIGAERPRRLESTADAAQALEPVAGGAAQTVFAVGILSAGLLAIPVIAGAGSSALAAFLGRDWGFSRSPGEAPAFYGLVVAGTLGGVMMSTVGVEPVSMLVTAAMVNGISAAPLLAVAMLLWGDRELMGDQRTGHVARLLGWAAVVLMVAAGFGGLVLLV
jgi:Mn2+/Fe2+ NRAMP family transporter